jgi:hypothetical protein
MVDINKWPKVDMDFLKQLISLHNEIAIKEKEEKEFDLFIMANKEKINNPDYLQVFAERVQITTDYYKEHYEVCRFFYDFMQENPEWRELPFGLRTYMRLGIFEETFKEFLITT